MKHFLYYIVTLFCISYFIPFDSLSACPGCCRRDCYFKGNERICKSWDPHCIKSWQKWMPRYFFDDFEEVGRPSIQLHWLTKLYPARKISFPEEDVQDFPELQNRGTIFPDIIEITGIVSAVSAEPGILMIHNPNWTDGIDILGYYRLIGCNDFKSEEISQLKHSETVTIRGELHADSQLKKKNLTSLRHCIVIEQP